MNVAFDHAEAVAHGIKTFWFRPERNVNYLAGQFTEIHFPHQPADARGVRRWFTLSSSPSEKLVAITTKLAPKEGSSFKKQLASLKPGRQLKLADPMGDFVLPKDPTIPLVFVAAGMGITPVRSMVKWLLDSGEQRLIQLLYAVSHLDELAFGDIFGQYNLSFTPLVKHPPPGYQGQSGSLSTGRILELPGTKDDSLIYLSGPEPMIETFFQELRAKGLPSERLITDYFPGYQKF